MDNSPTLASWLAAPPYGAPTVGGFLYVTLASLATGLTVSTIRWATIDRLHDWTGLQLPQWDFSKMQQNQSAYELLERNHYHYYQFHANMLVAVLLALGSMRLGAVIQPPTWLELGLLTLAVILSVGSRDTLKKYYTRVSMLLEASQSKPTTPDLSEKIKNASDQL